MPSLAHRSWDAIVNSCHSSGLDRCKSTVTNAFYRLSAKAYHTKTIYHNKVVHRKELSTHSDPRFFRVFMHRKRDLCVFCVCGGACILYILFIYYVCQL